MKSNIAKFLHRKTNSTAFIAEIDGFRFFAIITVLFYHLNTHFSRTIESITGSNYFEKDPFFNAAAEGGIGVNVFFAISGFILALPFAKQRLFNSSPVGLKAYYIRRITRLEPPYVISLVVLLGVHLILLGENVKDLFPNFMASLFYIHNIVFDSWSKINPVAWSLEVEVQFYVLAPFLASVFSITNKQVRRLVITAAIIIGMLHYNYNYDWIESLHLRKSLLMHLHQFLIGFLFADYFLSEPKFFSDTRSYFYDVTGIVSLLLLLIFNEPFNFFNDLIFASALFVSLFTLFKGKLVNRFFTHPWIVAIGGMCYSIYLLHYALVALIVKVTAAALFPELSYAANFGLQSILVIPIVIFACTIFFILIEKPCMDREWPFKLTRKIKSMLNPGPAS